MKFVFMMLRKSVFICDVLSKVFFASNRTVGQNFIIKRNIRVCMQSQPYLLMSKLKLFFNLL